MTIRARPVALRRACSAGSIPSTATTSCSEGLVTENTSPTSAEVVAKPVMSGFGALVADYSAETKEVARQQKDRGTFGFRAMVTILGSIPGTLLNTVVPLIAVCRGDVELPNVMLSDVMASHKLYEAVYTWGFSLTMVAMCFVLRESSSYWRRELPSLAPDVDRFVFLLYTGVAPCLFGLVAFQYSHDMSFRADGSDAGIMDVIYTLDFLLWFLHVFYTSIFFLSCCAMCYIYTQRLNPALGTKGLVHPMDRFWTDFASRACSALLPLGVVVRFLHLFLGTTTWGVLLVLVEVGMIQLFIVAGFLGVARLMMELDAEEPMMNLSNLFH